jgi:hypothetical protein
MRRWLLPFDWAGRLQHDTAATSDHLARYASHLRHADIQEIKGVAAAYQKESLKNDALRRSFG